jgi:hypothetical protein
VITPSHANAVVGGGDPALAPLQSVTDAVDPNDHTLDRGSAGAAESGRDVTLIRTDEGVFAFDRAAIERGIIEALANSQQSFNLGTLPSGKTLTITFQATVDAQTDKFLEAPTYTATVTSNQPTVTAGPANVTLDSLTLSGLIWGDSDRDGVRDAGEAALSGVTAEIYADTDHSGAYSAGDVLLGSTTTTIEVGGGNYSFTGLAPGDYIVRLTNGRAGFSLSGVGEGDPDDNVDTDDNGYVDGAAVYARTITLAYNTEVTNVTGADFNTTLDFALAADGGAGADTLIGESGADSLNGAGGADILVGRAGNDTLTGGAQTDTVDYSQDGGVLGVTASLAGNTTTDTSGATDT